MATARTWEDFEREYSFKQKFGEAAFKALKNMPFNQANHEHARKMIDFVTHPHTEADLNTQVNAALQMQHTPRADIRQEASAQMKNKNKQQFKTPKWGEKFEPAIQIIVDRFNQQLASSDRNKPLTQQYNNALDKMLRHQAELKLKAALKMAFCIWSPNNPISSPTLSAI